MSRGAEKALKALPERDLLRVAEHVRALAADPRPAGCRKIVGSARDWRIRVGDYRIIYQIDDRNRVVSIDRIRHRQVAYN